jgi:hypothetical protein
MELLKLTIIYVTNIIKNNINLNKINEGLIECDRKIPENIYKKLKPLLW